MELAGLNGCCITDLGLGKVIPGQTLDRQAESYTRSLAIACRKALVAVDTGRPQADEDREAFLINQRFCRRRMYQNS